MGWDERHGRTVEQRTKETSEDYRYFPEPDLPPLHISRVWVDRLRAALPELPDSRRDRFVDDYGLARSEASVLASDREVADYFEVAVAAGQRMDLSPRTLSNWILGELFRLLGADGLGIGEARIRPEALAELVALIEKGNITANTAKAVLSEMFETGRPPAEIVRERGLDQISDQEELARIVDEILAANPDQVARYREGKETLLQWFVGQVMRATRGKANPQVVMPLLQERLKA
jgi:aspartyl-tRNA(Asn)/glutamyl-tRNA(Gln) amidotransferase subunit B